MTIQKSAFIDGAILSIYEVTGKDEHDQPVYDKDAPFTTWTTRKLEKRHKVYRTYRRAYLYPGGRYCAEGVESDEAGTVYGIQ